MDAHNTWVDASPDDIRNDIIALAKSQMGLTNLKSVGVLRSFIEVLVLVTLQAYTNYINPIYHMANLNTATGVWLNLWGLMVGVVRKKAQKTTGIFSATAYSDGSVLRGTWIIAEGTGLRFKVVTDTAFVQGMVAIPVEAEFGGGDYNLIGEAPLRSTRIIQGIDAITVPRGWITALGTDDEKDDVYRARIKNKWHSLGEGSPPSKYEYLAATVDGVACAKVIRAPRGYGSVDLLIASVDGLPAVPLIDSVRNVIRSREMACRDFLVKSPVPVYCDVALDYVGNVDIETIRIAVRKYILSLGIGEKLEIRKLYTIPLQAMQLDSLEIVAPARDLVIARGNIIIPRTITITKKA